MPTREQLEKLLALDPQDILLNYGLAMELAKADSKGPALEQFERVIDLDQNYTAAYYQKGRLLLGLGRAGEAQDVLSAGVEAARRVGDEHAASEMRDLLELARSSTASPGSEA